MGYMLVIGEAKIAVPSVRECTKYGERELSVDVIGFHRRDAPTFPGDDMTGNGSYRHPSYTQWHNFCDEAGISDLFYNKESGYLGSHPGAVRIIAKDLAVIRDAVRRRKRSNNGMPPGWCECKQCNIFGVDKTEGATHKEFDGVLARLIWLEWWMDWALKNCKVPTFFNS